MPTIAAATPATATATATETLATAAAATTSIANNKPEMLARQRHVNLYRNFNLNNSLKATAANTIYANIDATSAPATTTTTPIMAEAFAPLTPSPLPPHLVTTTTTTMPFGIYTTTINTNTNTNTNITTNTSHNINIANLLQVDSLNNNRSDNNGHSNLSVATTTTSLTATTPTNLNQMSMISSQGGLNTLNNNGYGGHQSPVTEQPLSGLPIDGHFISEPISGSGSRSKSQQYPQSISSSQLQRQHSEQQTSMDVSKVPPQKRRSLLNFRSFDFHLKSLYTGLRNGACRQTSTPSSTSVTNTPTIIGPIVNDAGNSSNNSNSYNIAGPSTIVGGTEIDPRLIASSGGGGGGGAGAGGVGNIMMTNNRMPPYLKIESVDPEESENLLIDYPQSPYSSRRNSSHDDNRSSSQLLHINRSEMSRSPSPYFLSPYAMGSVSASGSGGNIRRSSTSDIVSCKRSGTSSASDSRRPSTSDLLRRARERRGSEARMGRSVSHSGLPRGGFRGGGGSGAGGRRTSMAF